MHSSVFLTATPHSLADGFFWLKIFEDFSPYFISSLGFYVILAVHVASYTAAVMPGHSSHLESQWQSAEHRATHHARGLGLGHWFWTMRMIISCSHFGCFFRDQCEGPVSSFFGQLMLLVLTTSRCLSVSNRGHPRRGVGATDPAAWRGLKGMMCRSFSIRKDWIGTAPL